jgi:nucleoside 2-deoxyribosyltransferase
MKVIHQKTERFIYTAGPISGCTYGECTGWRDYVAQEFYKLAPYIRTMSPMHGKTYLKREKVMGDGYPDFPLSTDHAIMCRDRNDVKRSDLVLFNFLDAPRVSIGTCIEIGWADAWQKPSVVVMQKGGLHDHSMVRGMNAVFTDNLDEGIQLAYQLVRSDELPIEIATTFDASRN